MSKKDVTELVPLPDYPEITVEYKELIGLERMGEQTIAIGKLGKKYRVKALLDGIETPKEREGLYDLMDRKVHTLRRAKILETDPARKFQIEAQLAEAEAEAEEL